MRSILLSMLVLGIPAAAWADPPGHVVQPDDGQFTVRFHGPPKESKQKTRTDLGNLTIYTATYALPEGGVLAASYTTFPSQAAQPADHKSLLDGAVKGLIGKNGKLKEEKEIEVGKTPGREVRIERGKQRLRYRLVVKDHRLIQVGAVGSGDFVDGHEAAAFLESLHFKE